MIGRGVRMYRVTCAEQVMARALLVDIQAEWMEATGGPSRSASGVVWSPTTRWAQRWSSFTTR